MVILFKFIYRVNAIPIKIQSGYFTESGKLILKFIWKFRGPKIVKTILKRNNKVVGLTLLNFKLTTKLQKSRLLGTGIRLDI